MNDQPHQSSSLTIQAGLASELHQHNRQLDDSAWIEVVQHMDSIYADLVHYQVELEEKNSALEDAQLFIQSVISSISDILIVCNINGEIQQVNHALEEVIGTTAEELSGKPISSLFSKKHLGLIAEFPEHIRSGSLIDCQIELISSDQKEIPMAINCCARFDHENRLSGMVVTGRPLGELRKAYSALHQAHEKLKTVNLQLIQSEKMASLGRLVAGVAHELNNPISFLYANMYALKNYQQKFKTYIDAVHANTSHDQLQKLRSQLGIDAMMDDINPLVEGSVEGAERISEIVQNLRKFTTPQEREKQSFNLIPVIKRAISWVLKAAKTNPEVIHNYPTEFYITNNEGYVHQILINLIQNAIDAMDHKDQPQLIITVNKDNNFAQLHIQDNGPGIKQQNLVKVFDPFFTTRAVGSGTGLGLYISYGLATEQCQGDLTVSNHKQGGAEFILSLPLEIDK
ncbi:MAG: PAS domain-containing protein [Gammaproteobacteria bacterium]|nr:PAS domain-containing protein [Gammaproteobacteria bacterium]